VHPLLSSRDDRGRVHGHHRRRFQSKRPSRDCCDRERHALFATLVSPVSRLESDLQHICITPTNHHASGVLDTNREWDNGPPVSFGLSSGGDLPSDCARSTDIRRLPTKDESFHLKQTSSISACKRYRRIDWRMSHAGIRIKNRIH
jgi:hypothetical protein